MKCKILVVGAGPGGYVAAIRAGLLGLDTIIVDKLVVVGIHAVGPHISELSGEFALALEMGARLEDIEGTIHVHPTVSESFAESALSALGLDLSRNNPHKSPTLIPLAAPVKQA